MSGRNGNDGNNKKKRSRRGRGKNHPPPSAKTGGDFWGDVEKLPPGEEVRVTSDGSAMVRSLGRPPIAGHEAISEHYLRAVYDQAVTLARVLATAGDLFEGEDGQNPVG